MNPDHRPSRFARVFGVIKTLITVIISLGALVLFLAWMGGAFHEKVPPGVATVERPQATGRNLVTAERTDGMETVTVVGSVMPRRRTEVASQLMATVREIKPRPGDRVKAGDVIIILDDRELVAQQREAIATLAATEADLITRRSNYQRIKSLGGGGSVSAEELNNVEGAFRVAETQVNGRRKR